MKIRAIVRRGLDFLLPPACGVCGGRVGSRRAERGAPAPGDSRRLPRMLCPRCSTRMHAPPPPTCARCHAPLGTRPAPDAGDGCRECREWPSALARVRSAAMLIAPADRMVYALKYGGWPEMAEEMVRPMAQHLPELARTGPGPAGEPVLIPVPTTARRRRTRGYNQARVLADALARRTGYEVVPALRRRERGGSQVALHRDERRANVRGAFETVGDMLPRLEGRRPILVDDVLTTGATAGEAAVTLDDAGAGPVGLVVFARALPGRRRDPDGSAVAPPEWVLALERRSADAGLSDNKPKPNNRRS